MTEEPTPAGPREDRGPETSPMPRWVPVAIGVILVSMGALAVITGLRYRDNTLVGLIRPRTDLPRATAVAPPGAPEPGASRIGGAVPQANEPVEGETRAQISGGPGGVSATVRMWARRGMLIKAEPSDAVVSVNGVPVGAAREFDSVDEIYDFAEPGSYDVLIEAPGYKGRRFVVTAAESAPEEISRIEVKLEKQ